MKNIIFLLITLCTTTTFAQHFRSGYYENGLVLAYNSVEQRITGYFDDATGWDAVTKAPMFTCSFYIEGKVMGNKAQVLTYYPQDKATDTISGTLELLPDQRVLLTLREEHGGCSNVQTFASNAIPLALNKPVNAIQIRYTTEAKTYFYSYPSSGIRLRKYMLKNEYFFVEKKIENNWGYCAYYGGEKTIKGYVKLGIRN